MNNLKKVLVFLFALTTFSVTSCGQIDESTVVLNSENEKTSAISSESEATETSTSTESKKSETTSKTSIEKTDIYTFSGTEISANDDVIIEDDIDNFQPTTKPSDSDNADKTTNRTVIIFTDDAMVDNNNNPVTTPPAPAIVHGDGDVLVVSEEKRLNGYTV